MTSLWRVRAHWVPSKPASWSSPCASSTKTSSVCKVVYPIAVAALGYFDISFSRSDAPSHARSFVSDEVLAVNDAVNTALNVFDRRYARDDRIVKMGSVPSRPPTQYVSTYHSHTCASFDQSNWLSVLAQTPVSLSASSASSHVTPSAVHQVDTQSVQEHSTSYAQHICSHPPLLLDSFNYFSLTAHTCLPLSLPARSVAWSRLCLCRLCRPPWTLCLLVPRKSNTRRRPSIHV
jgi:hypothetical protein